MFVCLFIYFEVFHDFCCHCRNFLGVLFLQASDPECVCVSQFKQSTEHKLQIMAFGFSCAAHSVSGFFSIFLEVHCRIIGGGHVVALVPEVCVT